MTSFWEYSLGNKWLIWGLFPVLSYVFGYMISVLFFEVLIRSDMLGEKYLISYRKISRKIALNNTESKISLLAQLIQVCWVLFGPTAIINGALGTVLFDFIDRQDSIVNKYIAFPTLSGFLREFILMEIIGDFFLYWGK